MPKSNLYPKTFIGCKWRQGEKLEKTLSLAKASLATMTCLKMRWTLYKVIDTFYNTIDILYF
jgi:hypothetical protein